jgi:hypothetical protein
MNHQEIEELLYTDVEVRQHLKELQRRRFQVKKMRKSTLAAEANAENFNRDDQGNGEEKVLCFELDPTILWPLPVGEPSLQGGAPPWS